MRHLNVTFPPGWWNSSCTCAPWNGRVPGRWRSRSRIRLCQKHAPAGGWFCRSGSRWDDDSTFSTTKRKKATKKRLEGPTYWLRLLSIYFIPIFLVRIDDFALKVVPYFGLVKCKKTSGPKDQGEGQGPCRHARNFARYKIDTCRDSLDGSEVSCKLTSWGNGSVYPITLQGINISHLGKRKIIFKMSFLGDMLIPWRVFTVFWKHPRKVGNGISEPSTVWWSLHLMEILKEWMVGGTFLQMGFSFA